MKCHVLPRAVVVATCLLFTFVIAQPSTVAQASDAAVAPDSALSIPQGNLIQPDALQHLLLSASSEKPLVLQVGSHVLYAEDHIPASEFVGPGSKPAGLKLLHDKVATLARTRPVVLYCGCCPWNRCPNIGPAFNALRQMGFTNLKVLYIADNFGTDWVDKGYAVEKGR